MGRSFRSQPLPILPYLAQRRLKPARRGARFAPPRRLTQQEFAARLGVPVETIRNWEQGKRAPRGPGARAARRDRACARDRVSGARQSLTKPGANLPLALRERSGRAPVSSVGSVARRVHNDAGIMIWGDRDRENSVMLFVEANGARIPAIGLGTWELRGRTCARWSSRR